MTIGSVTPWLDHPELATDFLEATAELDEVVVVDNGSTPPLSFLPERRPYRTVRRAYNLGFAGGCNAGLEAATADVVVFLNNDILLARPGWHEELLAAVEPGVLAGPIRYEPHAVVNGEPYPYIDGWCLAGWREDLLELGGFDEGYAQPGDFTDNDLCIRARAAGMTLREVRPGLRHKLAQTIGHRDSAELQERFTSNQERYAQRVASLTQEVPA